ncbi:MAG TPA: ribonuclease H-like domain-containing protein [Candidatus Acidoferrum sp.]|nr:ribonuclease H-like domain-containing protein [Candidatus Acidoferrum sp.]
MPLRPPKSYLVLDIETIPDTELWTCPEPPPGPAGGVDRTFPPTYAHRVIVIGCLWLDQSYRLKRFGLVGEGGQHSEDERSILADFSRFVGRNRPALVTYNGRNFDMPVLALRSLHCGVPMPWYYRDRSLRHRYSEAGHIDLCDWLADHGAARSSSLDALARLIGLPGKVGVDGSQIEGMFKAGLLARIQDYCLSDVVQTALLFLRFRLLQGVLDPGRYRSAVSALTCALAGDARLAGLMQEIDGDRLVPAAC